MLIFNSYVMYFINKGNIFLKHIILGNKILSFRLKLITKHLSHRVEL